MFLNLILLNLILLVFFVNLISADLNPRDTGLPNCTVAKEKRIRKRTSAKAGTCVMVKDEQGFLSEFVAYHVVQGLSHIIFYDDASIDAGLEELKPWIDKGYVTIRTNWDGYLGKEAVTWGKQMHQKKMMERDCKLTLFKWGYDYHLSVDIDEYLLPISLGITLVDAVDGLFTKHPTRGVFNINKLNFQPQPHILEPIDLLTIEAYQMRFFHPNKFGPTKGVMKKTVYRLRSPHYTNETQKLILECCSFHSCRQGPLPFCWDLHDQEIGKIFHPPWPEAQFSIFHYARSLEKFTLKQRTWKQHVKAGYGIEKYFDRTHGWTHDNRMLRYSCQVRALLKEVAGLDPFIRPGTWQRSFEVRKNPTGLYTG
jgi:hypothetical protein